MPTVSLKLPPPLHRKLAGTSRRTGRSKSALIREALEAYLDSAPLRGSFLRLARHVVGRFKGPRDLSTGKRHMEGFGR
jgi:predicted DNA-binding protein